MIGVRGADKIVVYGGYGGFGRVETTIGRLTCGEQQVIVDMLREPRCTDTFDQLGREGQIRDGSIRVKVIRVQLRFL